MFSDWQDIRLKRHYRLGKLVPDESYTVHLAVLVPRNIYGNYTIIVHSDSGNDVYEHGMDENNRRVSKVVLLLKLSYLLFTSAFLKFDNSDLIFQMSPFVTLCICYPFLSSLRKSRYFQSCRKLRSNV